MCVCLYTYYKMAEPEFEPNSLVCGLLPVKGLKAEGCPPMQQDVFLDPEEAQRRISQGTANNTLAMVVVSVPITPENN